MFLDRDGNGTVSNADEFSFIDDVPNARSDLERLAAFDSNGDGELSSADARFREFKIWRDRDGDGVVDRLEIMTLARAGVRSLSLTGTANSATYSFGETMVVNHGSFTRTNGRTGGLIDAVLTAVSSKGAADTAVPAGSLDFAGSSESALTLPALGEAASTDGALASLGERRVSAPPAIDASLLAGSFADAIAQVAIPPAQPRTAPFLSAAVDAPVPALLSVLDASAAIPASLEQQVQLMRQDMAAFAADRAVTTTWRRDEARPAELFAA